MLTMLLMLMISLRSKALLKLNISLRLNILLRVLRLNMLLIMNVLGKLNNLIGFNVSKDQTSDDVFTRIKHPLHVKHITKTKTITHTNY